MCAQRHFFRHKRKARVLEQNVKRRDMSYSHIELSIHIDALIDRFTLLSQVVLHG